MNHNSIAEFEQYQRIVVAAVETIMFILNCNIDHALDQLERQIDLA